MYRSGEKHPPKLRGSALVRETIRREIVDGRLSPGAVLPPHVELAKRFAVSNVTVQQALSQLGSQGFLDVRPRVGTFVAERPPHLNTYALVFCADPALPPPLSGRPWTRHCAALANEASRLQQETGRRILAFHGIDEHADSEDRARLIDYIETDRVAGVIFTHAPFLLQGSSILERPGIPRVAITADPGHGVEAVVSHARDVWRTKALDWLASLGHRRVATVGLSTPSIAHGAREEEALCRALTARGMISFPRWRQLASIRNPDSARRIAELLMNDRERPDALLITDDNFIEHVLAGLAAAGVRMPDDVAVVAHANFPWTPACALPVRLLGYDTRAVLRACMEIIDRQRCGKPVPAKTVVHPIWEEEYQAAAGVPVAIGRANP